MATARSTRRSRASLERLEPDTEAWRLPTKTRTPTSRDSSRSTSSRAPSRTDTDSAWRSAATASAASAPALSAVWTISSSRAGFMRRNLEAVEQEGDGGEQIGDPGQDHP